MIWDLIDLAWTAARITFIVTVALGGPLLLVFAVKESRREYKKARALEARWAAEPGGYDYQWQVDGRDIPGATAPTCPRGVAVSASPCRGEGRGSTPRGGVPQ